MKLTPFAKLFITVVFLAVVGFVVYTRFGGEVRQWATGQTKQEEKVEKAKDTSVTKSDFEKLGDAPKDPDRKAQVTGVQNATKIAGGKLSRPLVIGINTWAGHSPGIVYNRGLEPSAKSLFKTKLGIDVKFVLLEDPAAKLAAFRKGDIDVMWNTVDNWAREASSLSESSTKGKSIIMEDWSRGGDGIVSLASINSIEDLKGKRISCTQFTPSHFLLLYLLSQSGLSPEDRSGGRGRASSSRRMRRQRRRCSRRSKSMRL